MLSALLPVLFTLPAEPVVRFSPPEPRLGDLVILYLESTDERLNHGTIEVFGCSVPIDRVGDGLLRGFIGIPSDIEPGGYPTKIRFGDRTIDARTPVDFRKFPRSELRVSKRFTKKKSAALKRRLKREAATMAELWARDPTKHKGIGAVLRPVNGVFTSPFGVRRVFNGKTKSIHYGLDLDGRTGTPIRAALDGRVVMSSMRWISGGTMILDHGGGLFSMYFHMSRRDRKVGTYVEKGDLLGAVGKSGRVTGPHLHLSVVTRCVYTDPEKEGQTRSYYVDPEGFLKLSFEGDPAYLERPKK